MAKTTRKKKIPLKPNWHGISSILFYFRGEWSDPQIKYRGKFYNANIVDDYFWDLYVEECRDNNIKPNEDYFSTWMKKNARSIKDYLKYEYDSGLEGVSKKKKSSTRTTRTRRYYGLRGLGDVTQSNFKTETKRLTDAGLFDKEAIDLAAAMGDLIPYYDDAPEVKKEIDLCCKALTTNSELNSQAKGISTATSSKSNADTEKEKKLKLIAIRARSRARKLMLD